MAAVVLTAFLIRPSFVGHSNARFMVALRHNKSLGWASGLYNPVTPPNSSQSSLRVFVGVLSRAGNFKAREAIRQTWGKDPAMARVMFFVLRPDDDADFYRVRQESVTLGDMFVVSDVNEHYDRITYSTLALFKAAAVNPSEYTHVVKTDDDVYLRPSLLLHTLEGMPRERLYAGHPMAPGSAVRHGEWHRVPYNNWADDTPVKYGFGWGYVLSMDLAQEVAAGSVHLIMRPDNLLIIEDLAVGYWVNYVAQERGITINYDGSIPMGNEGCKDDFIFYHIKAKPQWRVIKCMHDHGGCCCP